MGAVRESEGPMTDVEAALLRAEALGKEAERDTDSAIEKLNEAASILYRAGRGAAAKAAIRWAASLAEAARGDR